MADQVGRREVGEVAHRRQRAVDRLAFERQPRAPARRRASLPCDAPSSSATIAAASSAKHAAIAGSNAPPGPLAHDTDRPFGPAALTLRIGVSGHVGDPYRQWNLVALHQAGVAPAVPALLKMREQRPRPRRPDRAARSTSAPPRSEAAAALTPTRRPARGSVRAIAAARANGGRPGATVASRAVISRCDPNRTGNRFLDNTSEPAPKTSAAT